MFSIKKNRIYLFIFSTFIPLLIGLILYFSLFSTWDTTKKTEVSVQEYSPVENKNPSLTDNNMIRNNLYDNMPIHDSSILNYIRLVSVDPREMFNEYLNICRKTKTNKERCFTKKELVKELSKSYEFSNLVAVKPIIANDLIDEIWKNYIRINEKPKKISSYELKAFMNKIRNESSFSYKYKSNTWEHDYEYKRILIHAIVSSQENIKRIDFSPKYINRLCHRYNYDKNMMVKYFINKIDFYIHDIRLQYLESDKMYATYSGYAFLRILYPEVYDIYREEMYSFANDKFDKFLKMIEYYCVNKS